MSENGRVISNVVLAWWVGSSEAWQVDGAHFVDDGVGGELRFARQ